MITLELLTSGSGSVDLSLINHVHGRVEQFVYADDIDMSSAALDYVETQPLSPRQNLRINNLTYLVPENAARHGDVRRAYDSFVGDVYIGDYAEIAATNQTVVDEEGVVKPLFWRHSLPSDVVEARLEKVVRGNRTVVDSGYRVDLIGRNIYTNYRNFFDVETGSYELYYVVATDSAGNASHELLEPVPVASEASWEDIDLDTGLLTTSYPLYYSETIGAQTKYTFNIATTWYVRPIADSLIQPLMPMALEANASWFLRFGNGDFRAYTNESYRRYYIREYLEQPFAPSAPYIFSPYDGVQFVNDSVLKMPRENIAIKAGLPANLFIYDYEGSLLKVFTTDATLAGTRYGNTDVFYEDNKFQAVDNSGGFVSLSERLLPSWSFFAQYTYNAKDFEYSGIDLNPIYNSAMRNSVAVFYCIPDLNSASDDRAIHHLVVDSNGTITECSQDEGVAYGNLQLWESDGVTPNPNTIIGSSYDDFKMAYAAGWPNSNAYMILAEVSLSLSMDFDDSLVYDVRETGGVPVSLRDAVYKQPRLLQSARLDNEDGQIVPKHMVTIIDAPISLLQEYGGQLTEEYARELILQHLDASVYPVVRWTYPAPELSATQVASGEIDVTFTWEGPGTYNVYQRANTEAEYYSVYAVAHNTEPVGRTVTVSLTGLDPDAIYHFAVSVTVAGIEYPIARYISLEA